MDTKRCTSCGREFSRPLSLSRSAWVKQRYCSRDCANRATGDRKRRRGRETKNCEQCGTAFTWPENYAKSQWEAKRFCSRACAHESLRIHNTRPPRQCVICGADYWSKYTSRHHCDAPRCKAEYRQRASAAASERMLRDYAAGKRKPAPGVSPRETLLWPLLADHGWVWRLRWIERDAEFELDFAHRALMLNVEIDGIEHREPRGRARDTKRDAALAAQGWRVLRIPNDDVDADAQEVANRILAWAAR